MSGPSIHLTYPEASLFKFPPGNLPPALPPPSDERTWKSPFPIDFDVYNQALDFRVPATVATTYIITVFLLNAYNRRRGNKPWWISTTRFFKLFVILHNVILAVYSGVTFYAMYRAISVTWPGFDNSNGLAGVADSLCKVSGPRGLGDAVYYNATADIWQTKNKLIQLMPEGTPDPTDVGRLWNEGLAFWGWLFYLSKFYEVLDTFIIIAKGKRSATLQTYHHAGAMLCMWAGIRYMSPPIWMFVFINSLIHTMMYTYFTLAAINIRVPNAVKRTLTTLQIAQFLFGASYAALHLFVKYDVPVATAYTIFHPISSAIAQASSTVSSAVSVAAPTESYGAILRRILLRAAGDEGVAENVRDNQGNYLMDEVKEAVQRYHEETRHTTEYHTVDCIDTSGESFAIWLNLFYLFPLTVLFLRFFYRAYIGRGNTPKSRTKRASRSAVDAAKDVDDEVEDAGKAIEKKIDSGAKDIQAEIEKDLKALKEGKLRRNSRPVSDRVRSFESKTTPNKKDAQQVKRDAADSVDDLKEHFKKAAQDEQRIKQEGADSIDELKERVKKVTEDVSEPVKDSPSDANSPPSTPSKKKNNNNNKRRNKKKQNAEAAERAEAEHTDGAESDAGGAGDEQDQPDAIKYAANLEDLEDKAEKDVKEEKPSAGTA